MLCEWLFGIELRYLIFVYERLLHFDITNSNKFAQISIHFYKSDTCDELEIMVGVYTF